MSIPVMSGSSAGRSEPGLKILCENTQLGGGWVLGSIAHGLLSE
jgi:hypothetical protein